MQQAEMADSTRQTIFTGGKMDGNAGASRRNVMSAMLVAPFLCAAVAGCDPVSAERSFDDLIQRYVGAAAALNAAAYRPVSDQEEERLTKAYTAASTELWKTPAPTWRQFVFKLEQAWDDDDDPPAQVKAWMLKDARQLAAIGATA